MKNGMCKSVVNEIPEGPAGVAQAFTILIFQSDAPEF